MQRRNVHGLVSEILVDREKAVLSGPKAAIAAQVPNGEVRSFVREWRRGQSGEIPLSPRGAPRKPMARRLCGGL